MEIEDGGEEGAVASPAPDKPMSLKAENAALKKQLKELQKTIAKQAKQIETLMAKAEKAKERGEKGGEGGKAAKGEAEGEGAAEGPTYSEDPAHYLAWVKSVLGAKGEKADAEYTAMYENKGAKGLAKLLVKRYKAEHK